MPSEPGSMTPYQNLCERLLLEILNGYDSETLSRLAFKVTAKSLIRFYPEFTMANENPYKVFDLYKKCFRFSKRGWDQYQKDPGKVAYEHIQPIENIQRASECKGGGCGFSGNYPCDHEEDGDRDIF